jgi:hypothetical protein
MPKIPTQTAGALTLADIRARGVSPRDINELWLDRMVKRLFLELQRQLSQVETAKPAPEIEQAGLRAANARTLASLERTLERLTKMEQQRALMRETKVAAAHDGARARLERRLDQLLIAVRTQSHIEESER